MLIKAKLCASFYGFSSAGPCIRAPLCSPSCDPWLPSAGHIPDKLSCLSSNASQESAASEAGSGRSHGSHVGSDWVHQGRIQAGFVVEMTLKSPSDDYFCLLDTTIRKRNLKNIYLYSFQQKMFQVKKHTNHSWILEDQSINQSINQFRWLKAFLCIIGGNGRDQLRTFQMCGSAGNSSFVPNVHLITTSIQTSDILVESGR